ncbi:MAG: hypothetical protein ACOH2E_08255 [Candidatus Paracaedibacter sp.]
MILLLSLSPLIQATEKMLESNHIPPPKFLPIFEGQMEGLGKVTIMVTVHYEPDAFCCFLKGNSYYFFEKDLFSSYTSLMIEHDLDHTESAIIDKLISKDKGFLGNWYYNLPLTELQKKNLGDLFKENQENFKNRLKSDDCEISQIHPFLLKEIWVEKIHKKVRTLKTFEETLEGKLKLRVAELYNKPLKYLEPFNWAHEEEHNLKQYTSLMQPFMGCEKLNFEPILTLLEIMDNSFEEMVAECKESISRMYQSLFTQEWMGKTTESIETRDTNFAESIINEMQLLGEKSNIFVTFGADHTKGVLESLHQKGLSFVQQRGDGSESATLFD